MTKSLRSELVAGISELQQGQRKLAGLLAEQKKLIPTEDQRKEASQQRDEITDALVTAGLVPEIDKLAVRESLDSPGGLETVANQLVTLVSESKTAGKEAGADGSDKVSSIGRVSHRSDAPVRSSGRQGSYQPLYHH